MVLVCRCWLCHSCIIQISYIYIIYYFILHTPLDPKTMKKKFWPPKKNRLFTKLGFGRPTVYDQCGPSRAPIFPAGWIQIGCTIWSGQSRIAMGVSSRVCWPSLRIPGWTLQWRTEFEPVGRVGVFWGPQKWRHWIEGSGFLGLEIWPASFHRQDAC